MNDHALQAVFRSVVLATLLYSVHVQRIETIVRRGVRTGLYPGDGLAAAQLVEDSDDALFRRPMSCEHHVLHGLLPDQSDHDYYLRPRRLKLTLSSRMNHPVAALAFDDWGQ